MRMRKNVRQLFEAGLIDFDSGRYGATCIRTSNDYRTHVTFPHQATCSILNQENISRS